MRITTGMIATQFSKNLNKSLSQLNMHNNRATTGRRFDRVSEAPLAAIQAFRIRNEMDQNDAALSNAEDVDNFLATAESALMGVNSLVQGNIYQDCIKAVNGSMSGEERDIMAGVLKEAQRALVTSMNTKFGGEYLFGGAERTEPPFAIGEDGALMYKGVNVNTGLMEAASAKGGSANIGSTRISFGDVNGAMFNDVTINVTQDKSVMDGYDPNTKTINIQMDKGQTNNQLLAKLQGVVNNAMQADGVTPVFPAGSADSFTITSGGSAASFGKTIVTGGKNEVIAGTPANLELLSSDKLFVDLGLGLHTDSKGQIVDTSAFDSALNGLDFLGFGTNDAGVPNNLYTLIGDLAAGLTDPAFSIDKVQPLLDNFEGQYQSFLTKIADFGAKTSFITETKDRLKDLELNLATKSDKLEFLDPAEAIMNFKSQEYAYHTALQMGTKLFLPTFLDFMN